jgi:predicted RNA binding protein YcfA (HicA-like mRNA interferase family)
VVRTRFSGREIAGVLTDMGYTPVDRTGSHLKLRYVHPETGEVRNVTVPLGLRSSGTCKHYNAQTEEDKRGLQREFLDNM